MVMENALSDLYNIFPKCVYLLILGAEKLASMLNIVLISCITRQEQSKDINRMIRSLKSQTEQSPTDKM
jgi:hypothetical protein